MGVLTWGFNVTVGPFVGSGTESVVDARESRRGVELALYLLHTPVPDVFLARRVYRRPRSGVDSREYHSAVAEEELVFSVCSRKPPASTVVLYGGLLGVGVDRGHPRDAHGADRDGLQPVVGLLGDRDGRLVRLRSEYEPHAGALAGQRCPRLQRLRDCPY